MLSLEQHIRCENRGQKQSERWTCSRERETFLAKLFQEQKCFLLLCVCDWIGGGVLFPKNVCLNNKAKREFAEFISLPIWCVCETKTVSNRWGNIQPSDWQRTINHLIKLFFTSLFTSFYRLGQCTQTVLFALLRINYVLARSVFFSSTCCCTWQALIRFGSTLYHLSDEQVEPFFLI